MIGTFLKKIIGDKNAKDQIAYQPFIDSVKSVYPEIESLSDNELRLQTRGFIDKIQEEKSGLEDQLEQLKEKAENPEISIQDKSDIFEKVEKLEKEINEQIETTLEKIAPKAFAVIKETAYRWSNNGQLVVDAEDYDRDLAVKRDGISIQENQAVWHNKCGPQLEIP